MSPGVAVRGLTRYRHPGLFRNNRRHWPFPFLLSLHVGQTVSIVPWVHRGAQELYFVVSLFRLG